MKSYLDEINSRLAAILLEDIDPKPIETMKPEHKALGVLSEKGQKMFAVWQSFEREHNAFHENETEESSKKIAREHNDICTLVKICEKLFWSEVHEEFLAAAGDDNDYLAILEGFMVVTGKREDEEKSFNPFEGLEGVQVITIGVDGPGVFGFMRE